MLFKFVSVAAIFASVVSGSAVNLEARQVGELAACTIRTTPSNTPNPTSGLLDEFITLVSQEFFDDLPPGNGVVTGTTSFTGPSGGVYTIAKTIGATSLTAEQSRQVIRAWTGQTFPGRGGVGVTSWFINSATCP